MRFLFLFFMLIAAGLHAAGDDDYFPLAEGAEWIMDAKIIAADGKETAATVRRQIGPEEEHDGRSYHSSHNWTEGDPQPVDHTGLIRKDTTGAYTLNLKALGQGEQAEVPFPLEVGKSWQFVEPERTLTFKIIGFETLTINGVIYEKCLHLHASVPDGSYVAEYWRAPKIGALKSEVAYANGAKRILTLREFKPGKK